MEGIQGLADTSGKRAQRTFHSERSTKKTVGLNSNHYPLPENRLRKAKPRNFKPMPGPFNDQTRQAYEIALGQSHKLKVPGRNCPIGVALDGLSEQENCVSLNDLLKLSPRDRLEQRLIDYSNSDFYRRNKFLLRAGFLHVNTIETWLETEWTIITLMIENDLPPSQVRQRALQLHEIDDPDARIPLLNRYFPNLTNKVVTDGCSQKAAVKGAIDRASCTRWLLMTSAGSDQQRKLVTLILDTLPRNLVLAFVPDILWHDSGEVTSRTSSNTASKEALIDTMTLQIKLGEEPDDTTVDEFVQGKIRALGRLTLNNQLKGQHIESLYATTLGDTGFRKVARSEKSDTSSQLKDFLNKAVHGLFAIAHGKDLGVALLLNKSEARKLSDRIDQARKFVETDTSDLVEAMASKTAGSPEKKLRSQQQLTTLVHCPLARRIIHRMGELEGIRRANAAAHAISEWADQLVEDANNFPSLLNALLQLEPDHLKKTYAILDLSPKQIERVHKLTDERLETYRERLLGFLPPADVEQGNPLSPVRQEMRTTEATLANDFGILVEQADDRWHRVSVNYYLEREGFEESERVEVVQAMDVIVDTGKAMRPFHKLVATAKHPEELFATREGLAYCRAQALVAIHHDRIFDLYRKPLVGLKVAPKEGDNQDPVTPGRMDRLLQTPIQRLTRWLMLSQQLGKQVGKEKEELEPDSEAPQEQGEGLKKIIGDLADAVAVVNEHKRSMELLAEAAK